MSTSPNAIAEKVKLLTSEQLSEVDDFIEFIRCRSHDREMTYNATAMSSPVFDTIWENPEDAAYDAL